MATEFTASASSGYMTDVQYGVVGNYRVIVGHYSSPTASTAYIRTGLPILQFYNVDDADPTTFSQATDGAGGILLYFSGLVVGATGRFFILGG